MIEADLLNQISKRIFSQAGAYATYLSGAGPTVMVLAPKEQESKILEAVQSLGLDGEVVALHVDTKGVFVEKD